MKLNKLCALLSCLCAALVADVAIDCSNAAIVLGEPRLNDIGQELKLHLELISSKAIPVVAREQAPAGAYSFNLGIVPDDGKAATGPEEGRWDIRDREAFFYGASPLEVRHAVYDFLESSLGVRWPSANGIFYNAMNPIQVSKTTGSWSTALRLHYIRTSSRDNFRWAERMHRGAHLRPDYGHAFTKYWDRFSRTHQDYFAMREDGLRLPMNFGKSIDDPAAGKGRTQTMIAMCVSNEDLARQVVKDWIGNGRPWCINLCENDAAGADSCHCAACRALDPKDLVLPPENGIYNCFADRYITFANRVIAEARKSRPGVKLCTYAYNASEQPPKNVKVDKDIILGVVPVSFTLKDIKAYIDGWQAAGMNEFFYRPNRHYYYDTIMLPLGAERHFFEIARYIRKANAIGFDYDAQSCLSIYQYNMDYMVYKAMYDAEDRPFEYWEDHYAQAYGNAAQDVKDYFRFWRETVWEGRVEPQLDSLYKRGKYHNVGRGIVWFIQDFYKEEDFGTAARFLDAAQTRNLTPAAQGTLDALRTAHEHATLFFRAAAHKSDDNARKLLKFRRDHSLPEVARYEKEWGDVCSIVRVRNFDDYDPPFVNAAPFWRFRLDPKDAGRAERWFADDAKAIAKWPYFMSHNAPWERQPGHYKQITDEIRNLTANYDGIAWYAQAISVPKAMKGRDVFLYFGAVDESAWIYVNGKEAGTHLFTKPDDWSVPFVIPVNDFIDWSKPRLNVVVRVEDKSGLGGIWKPVFIISKKKPTP